MWGRSGESARHLQQVRDQIREAAAVKVGALLQLLVQVPRQGRANTLWLPLEDADAVESGSHEAESLSSAT